MDDLNNNDIQKMYDKAQEFYEKQDYTKALELFNKISASWPDFSVLNYIGCCYIGIKEYLTAESIFKELISKAPEWERPYFNLARVYMEIGQDNKAYKLLKNAIEINPNDGDSYFYMGVYYRKKGQWNNAIEYFLKSEELDEMAIDIHINLSVCYAEIGDYEKALAQSTKALDIDSSYPDTLFNVSKVLITLKNFEKAFDILYDKSTSFNNDIGLLKNLFIAALKTDNHNVCVETAKKILAIDKNESVSKNFLSGL